MKPIETDSAKRAKLMDLLWNDPKYLRLHARKDRLLRAWNEADAFKNQPGGSVEKAQKLDAAVKRALKRIYSAERAVGL